MTYDFTTLPDRTWTQSVKWQEVSDQPDLLPLWIADMDFLALPDISQAIETYAKHGVYGYAHVSDSLLQAIVDWEASQHGYMISKEDILLIEGVVPAISVVIQAFTQEGDAVLINTPVYPPFARTVKLNNRQLVTNSLVEREGRFEIDFDQLEKDLVDNQVKLYIFCNPHNPGGRVWTKAELQQLGALCRKHGVLLVSDEIHQDLTLFGHVHHSFNTVSPDFKDFALVLASATKTFNIAGTKNSFVIIENPALRVKFKKQQLANNQHEISTLGLMTTEVALTKGEAWLRELKSVLESNARLVVERLSSLAPKIKVMVPEGTYLIWLDFSAYGLSQTDLMTKLKSEAGLLLNDGTAFGKEGQGRARLNVAAPTSLIEEACQRLGRVFGS